MEESAGGRVRVDVNEINHFQGRQALRPKLLRDVRPLVALVDLGIAGERDDEQIALTTGEFEVTHMARMNDIEAAMAMNDRMARRLSRAGGLDELVAVDDLPRIGFAHTHELSATGPPPFSG